MVFLVVVLIVGGLSAYALNYVGDCKSGDGPHTKVQVTIPEGASGGDVVNILHEAGVMKCGGIIGKFLMRNDDRSNQIRSGHYTLRTNMTIGDALAVLTKQPELVERAELPIPEGFRLTQIADRVHEVFGIPAKKFLEKANSGDYFLKPYLPEGTKSPEGFLFPAVYQIPVEGVTADKVIRTMLDRFDAGAAELDWKPAKRLGLTPYEIVNVASMIEKEAGTDEDRPLIAAVIYNRLENGMQLGIDATLLYDDPTPGDGQLTDSDLDSDSPYNTRRNTGLPPTPISSPGEASLQAALNPAHVDYLYYVACPKDGEGKSRFSKTNGEFLQDKSECLGG